MTLKYFLAEADRCSQCSYCKWIPFDQIKSWRFAKNCPSISYFNFNSYSARGRYAITRSLLKDQSKITEEVQKIVFSCMTCGSCDVSCKVCRYNLEPLDMVRELKFHLVEKGYGIEAHEKIISGFNKEHNTMMQPKNKRGDWAEHLDIPEFSSQECDILFFAGCKLSYDNELQDLARSAVKLLKECGVKIGLMPKLEMCCGSRVYSMGYKDEFARSANANIKMWSKAGVKRVVTPCADCYYAFKRLYPQLGADLEVFHLTEFIYRLIKEGKIKFNTEIPMRITYHDPCHLGRQGEPYIPWHGGEKKIKKQVITYEPRKPRNNGAWGIYDTPREIIKKLPGIEFIEMERIREYSWCCGAGGGANETFPEYSLWTALERIEEAKATGAEAIISACPWCEKNFKDAIKTSKISFKVYDILDLVKKAL